MLTVKLLNLTTQALASLKDRQSAGDSTARESASNTDAFAKMMNRLRLATSAEQQQLDDVARVAVEQAKSSQHQHIAATTQQLTQAVPLDARVEARTETRTNTPAHLSSSDESAHSSADSSVSPSPNETATWITDSQNWIKANQKAVAEPQSTNELATADVAWMTSAAQAVVSQPVEDSAGIKVSSAATSTESSRLQAVPATNAASLTQDPLAAVQKSGHTVTPVSNEPPRSSNAQNRNSANGHTGQPHTTAVNVPLQAGTTTPEQLPNQSPMLANFANSMLAAQRKPESSGAPQLDFSNAHMITGDRSAVAASSASPGAQPMTGILSHSIGSNAWNSQLQENIVHMISRNNREMTLHLTPAELGPLKIHVVQDENTTKLQILAHNQHVRGAIENALPQLRDALQAQGIQLADANVSDQEQQWNNSSEQQRHARSSFDQQNASEFDVSAENLNEDQQLTTVQIPSNGRVDLYA